MTVIFVMFTDIVGSELATSCQHPHIPIIQGQYLSFTQIQGISAQCDMQRLGFAVLISDSTLVVSFRILDRCAEFQPLNMPWIQRDIVALAFSEFDIQCLQANFQ